MAIETRWFALAILILVTLVTFPALSAFTFAFSFGIPFGVAFGISFREQ
jgi:hypothetical protein